MEILSKWGMEEEYGARNFTEYEVIVQRNIYEWSKDEIGLKTYN